MFQGFNSSFTVPKVSLVSTFSEQLICQKIVNFILKLEDPAKSTNIYIIIHMSSAQSLITINAIGTFGGWKHFETLQ